MKEFITGIAKEAGDLAVSYLGKVKISSKGEKNVVTEADKAVEELILKMIKEKYPEHNIIAEESEDFHTGSDFTWYIDPIDGTSNYSHTDPNFCVSIALAERKQIKHACIYIPSLDEMYYAEKGQGAWLNGERVYVSKVDKLKDAFIQTGISPLKHSIDESMKLMRYFTLNADRARDYGFCAGQLAFVSVGRAEALIKRSQHPWDVAAGMLLIEEAGGKVTDEDGQPIDFSGRRFNLIASNSVLHDTLLKSFKDIKLGKIEKHWY
jgi:myo-inositol-1(or 4)-monophosphatase